MKNVEQIRVKLVATLGHALGRMRYLCSSLDNGTEIADMLSGDSGVRILVQLVDTALLEMGHVTQLDGMDQNGSATARAVKRGKVTPRGAALE